MAIKKAYVEIIDFLEANKDKKVNTILEDVIALASAKQARNTGNTFLRDSSGNVVAILCYYFKRWMPLVGQEAVEFGAKKSTATGLNTMCKEGVSNWTKQNNMAKKAHEALLTRLEAEEIIPADIPAEKERIEQERRQVVETDLGFETKEEVVAYLQENGVTVAE